MSVRHVISSPWLRDVTTDDHCSNACFRICSSKRKKRRAGCCFQYNPSRIRATIKPVLQSKRNTPPIDPHAFQLGQSKSSRCPSYLVNRLQRSLLVNARIDLSHPNMWLPLVPSKPTLKQAHGHESNSPNPAGSAKKLLGPRQIPCPPCRRLSRAPVSQKWGRHIRRHRQDGCFAHLGSKLNHRGTAGFSPWFRLPGQAILGTYF